MLSNLFVLCMQVMCWDNPPIVETTMGKIKGQYRTTQGDTTFSAFEGIPYAQPPVEQLRFKEPFPAAQWHNTLEANTTHTCIQMTEDNKIIGTEDCLYLNIYVPGQKINTRNNFNVLVHLHAGEFSFSSGHSYTNPDNLMENNFILVTLNYRLGIMGFLSTEDHIVPGNNGLKDQVMALKWIQENIKYFGGNHDSVMLTGIEAGGASVHFHYFSKLSKNIFHYGLSESGTALNPWALQDDARHKAVKIATSVQCPSGDSLEMVDCLREKPADLLVGKFILFISSGFPVAPFAPVVEKHVDDTTFLRDHPYRLLLEGNFQHLPWVVGISDYEGKNLVRRINVNRLKMLWKMSAPSILDYKNTIGRHKWNMVAKEIYNFYSKRAPHESVTNNTIAEILHDRLFLMDTELAVKLQTRTSEAQVHYYQHQNDSLKCIFSRKCDKFLQMLREYASKGIPSFEDINWPPEDFSQLTYLQINNEEIVINTKEDNTVEEFWSHLGFRENQHLFN